MTSPLRSSSCSTVPFTQDALLNALLLGWKWGGAVGTATSVSLSFPGSGSTWSTDSYYGYGPRTNTSSEPWNAYFSGLDATEKAGTRAAMAAWNAVANVGIYEVTETSSNVGDIRVAYTAGSEMDADTYAYTWVGNYTPSSQEAYFGDIWLNAFQPIATGYDFTLGACGYSTILHEMGHAIGLDHPFSLASFPTEYDSYKYSVMSYSDTPGHYDEGTCSIYPTTPMLLDIQALQYLYGANMRYHTGNDTYTFSEGQNYYQTIWDAGGADTIVYASSKGGLIDLNEACFSQLGNAITLSNGTLQYDNVAIAYGVVIENATGGSGNDVLIGNAVANLLMGGAGNDTLTGAGGDDSLDGGDGLDTALMAITHAQALLTLSDDSAHISDKTGELGSDTLLNVERVLFVDGTLALDIGEWETAGEAYRLYQAAFGRTPDIAGLNYWIDEIDGGQTHLQVAHNFIVSAEFQTRYGANPSDVALVTAMYQNVLGRTPDQAGFDYWLDQLADSTYHDENLLISFSESAENIALVGNAIANGIWLG